MKKIAFCYICLFIALGCFMNFLGINNVGFDSALNKAVSFINGIGDVSRATLKLVLSVDDAVAPGLERYPYSYRKAYDVLLENHSGCSSECPFTDPDSVLEHVKIQFYSDFLFYIEHKKSLFYGDELNIIQARMRYGSNSFLNLFKIGEIPDDLMSELSLLYQELYDSGVDNSLSVGKFLSVSDSLSELCPYLKKLR